MRTTVRARMGLLGVLVIEGCLVTALHRLSAVPWLAVDYRDPLGWLAATPAEDALAAATRLAALAVAWWLLASTALCLLSRLAGLPGLGRALDWTALPAVRRLTDRAVAVALSASVGFSGPLPAQAVAPFAPPPDAVAVTELAEPQTRARPAGVAVPSPARASQRPRTPAGPARDPRSVRHGARADPHIVRRGEHLWGIAAKRLTASGGARAGAPTAVVVHRYWRLIVCAVIPTLRSGDPDLIHPGERLQLPPPGRGGHGEAPLSRREG